MSETLRLIDVGARGGVDPRWKPFFKHLSVLGFEPDREECASLNSTRFPYKCRFLPFALGSEDGIEATLNMCVSPGSSSLMEPNHEVFRHYPYSAQLEVVRRIPLTLTRLDTACADFQPDVIKLDTQGTELDILHGAGHLLDQTLAVEIEVEFVQIYKGQPLFADIDIFMREHGFSLRGLRRTYWRIGSDHPVAFGGQLFHGDALYTRPERMDTEKGHKILAAYRQYDLLNFYQAKGLVPKRPLITRVLSKLLSRLPNKQLRKAIDSLRHPSATDWHDPDFF
jgi:FkbM family methyltransferase